jgi:hypothetical protein
VTRVFAMPYNGQCLNVGRAPVIDSLQTIGFPERHQSSSEQRQDAKDARIVEKDEAQISRSRSGLRNWNCRVLDYWSLPTVSSVETGLR